MYMQINIKFFNNSFHLSKATQTLVLIMERERERERENFYLLRASGGWSISSTLSLPIIPWVHCSLLSSCIVLSETPVWQKNQTIQIVMCTFYVCTFKSYFISQMHFIQISNSSTVYILFVQFKNFYHIHGKISNKDFLCLLYNI